MRWKQFTKKMKILLLGENAKGEYTASFILNNSFE